MGHPTRGPQVLPPTAEEARCGLGEPPFSSKDAPVVKMSIAAEKCSMGVCWPGGLGYLGCECELFHHESIITTPNLHGYYVSIYNPDR